ncbi:uncharacterized protein LOC119769284 [Culex quinquefasciatus]|uniref:uncharacterized protein LOC119769284 n=1 Tax=Culex quinquefasciatus TaxID=7176 RepID=UPI0018E34F5A|nr:uncharacterized protein LOC119769284 [Culex quinquefasciatus]
MFKIIALGALLVCCAVMTRAVPVDQTELDEMAEAPVAGVSQTSQAVVEQEPKISAPKESDVEMSEQNKEAMENAETIGFGYHKTTFHVAPRVFVPPYPLPYHAVGAYGYGVPAIPSYGGYGGYVVY